MKEMKMDEDWEKLLEACPDKISPPELAALIANIVNMYEFPHFWPMMAAQISHLLQEHEAVCDAEDFLNRVTKGTMH